jgi:hypothetical protein
MQLREQVIDKIKEAISVEERKVDGLVKQLHSTQVSDSWAGPAIEEVSAYCYFKS